VSIKKPAAVESPYVITDTTPTRLASAPVAGGGVSTVAATVAETVSATADANTDTTTASAVSNVSYYASGIEGIAGLANQGRVFEGANIYVTLEQPQYNTYNTNYTGSANIGGANGQIQFNNNDLFAGSANLTFDGANLAVGGKITGTQLSTTGNITGGYFIGNGSQLTGISASTNKILNGNSYANIASANGSLVIGINGTYTWSFEDTGTLTFPASPNGQIYGGLDNDFIITTANANAATYYFTFSQFGDLSVPINLNVSGNVYTNDIVGAGTSNVAITANTQSWLFDTTGTITLPSTGQIRSVGNTGVRLSAGASDATGLLLDNTGDAEIYANGNVSVYTDAGNIGWTFGNTGTLTAPGSISAVGNVTGGNLRTGGLISAAGNVTAGNVSTGIITLTNGAVIRDTAGDAVAFGQLAGNTSQGNSATAVGYGAGQATQGQAAVAVGVFAGNSTQGDSAVAIGQSAGSTTQGTSAVAIGALAGNTTQGLQAVAIGLYAGTSAQGQFSVAVGPAAGQTTQGQESTAIGSGAGSTAQGNAAVAIGSGAGAVNQRINSVAIGASAGAGTQGDSAVAIGASAGVTNQGNNSIILNATGANLDQTTANTFTVAPVRNDVANTAQVMFYNTTSKEITYGNTISVAGNITGGNIQGTIGDILNVNSTNLTVTNILAPSPGNVVNIGAGGNNNLVVSNVLVQVQNVPVSVAGNVTGGNILTGGLISATANITGGNLTTSGLVSATGNVNAANVVVTPGIGTLVLGKATATGSPGLSSTSSLTFTANRAGTAKEMTLNDDGGLSVPGNISTSANVSGGNVLTGGLISATANVTGGNLATAGNISMDWVNIGNIGNIAVLAADVKLQITADAASNNAPYWTFNNDGTLYVPGNISGDNGAPLIVEASGSGEGYISLPHATFGNEQVAMVNKFTSGNGIRLETNGGNLFFDNTGILSVPGNIIMPPGTALKGSGASPAPSISGFTSISAESLSATGNITGGNLAIIGNTATITSANYAIGYRDIPQISLASNVTTALTDAGKHYYSTSASDLALTIANNTSVVWPVGTAISIVNANTGNILINQGTGVSLYLAGNATAGNRVLATFGMATIMNTAANVWFINGTGLT
jgi:hypothetical protein